MSAPTNRSIQKVKGNPYDGPVMWEVQRNVGKMAKLTQDSFAFWTVQLENYLACLPKAVDILLGHGFSLAGCHFDYVLSQCQWLYLLHMIRSDAK